MRHDGAKNARFESASVLKGAGRKEGLTWK